MSKFDEICEVVGEFELSVKQAVGLRRLMEEFRENSFRSYRGLMRIPAFKKLWEALEEAIDRTHYEYQINADGSDANVHDA